MVIVTKDVPFKRFVRTRNAQTEVAIALYNFPPESKDIIES